MGKAPKSTKKFAASGKLKKTIQARRKHQQIKKRVDNRRGGRSHESSKLKDSNASDDDEDTPVEEKKNVPKGLKRMSVDDFLGGSFMNEDDDEDNDAQDMGSDSQLSEEEAGEDGDESFASVDDIDEEGENHLLELSKLAEKDPEFYKYLQEHDHELLEFDPNIFPGEDNDDDPEDGNKDITEDDMSPVLTKDILSKWQKALLKQRSLRALRKLLIAFRSAAHMNEENQVLAWTFDSSSVYNKLVTTALRYTPVVLEHHVPYKTLPNGKFKPPIQTIKFRTLQKLILSHFHNIIHMLSQLTDNMMIQLSITESVKLVPYVVSNRKAIKLYLKKCLELWSSAGDSVRIAAFLAIQKLALATDGSIMDLVLKNTYLTLVRSSKITNTFNLPSINLMKNSAAEIFCIDHLTTYQHAFGYIRQLAIHLRNSMKVKSKDAYKQVYNWQYVHCVDFWAIVLARACTSQTPSEGGEDVLKPLIHPLVQVSLGAIKLISNARSYPFHLQIIRSLLHLTRHTESYIPISPYLLPILTSTLSSSSRPKSSTLRPLDLEVHIRAPQQYVKTRIYAENLVEEAVFLLAEWLASRPVHGSVAFPEVAVPVTVTLRKAVKSSSKGGCGIGKDLGIVKGLVERIEESARWIEQKRKGMTFAPGKIIEVEEWELGVKGKIESSPLGKYVKVQRKTRDKRRNLIDKARDGEEEILEN